MTTIRKAFIATAMLSSLNACISYEPAVLVPEITLSAENIDLEATSSAQVYDFGVQVGVNESDSLFNVEVLPGVVVRAVTAGGAADAAGIQVGDIILRINDLEINQPDSLRVLEQTPADSNRFEFTLRRNTAAIGVTVNAREMSTAAPARELYRIDPIFSRAGYRSILVDTAEGELAAARVVEIFADSPLPDAGIATDDLILALNGRRLNSAQDLVSRLNLEHELGERVQFTLYRDGRQQTVNVDLWDPGRRIARIALGPVVQYEASLNPDSRRLSIVDLWLFSVYSYQQREGERSHSILGLFNFSTDYGELVEE